MFDRFLPHLKFLTVVCVAMVIAACGGGGGSDSSDDDSEGHVSSFSTSSPTLPSQNISFVSPGNQTLVVGTAPATMTSALEATATSGLPVSLTSVTRSVCTVSGVALTMLQPGTCTLAATQAGDATHAAAPTVSQSFYVIASNAAAGKAAYNLVINEQSCFGCHGVPGSQPTSLILSAANADVVLGSAIMTNVGGMGILQGNYTAQQIIDIVAYLATPGI